MKIRRATLEETAAFPSFETVKAHGKMRSIPIPPGADSLGIARLLAQILHDEIERNTITDEDMDLLLSMNIKP